jgi:rubredoxin
MDTWKCTVCGYEYDPTQGEPDHGIDPGTAFEDLADAWRCPICLASKGLFVIEVENQRGDSSESYAAIKDILVQERYDQEDEGTEPFIHKKRFEIKETGWQLAKR